jgi:hypothetical protein
MGAQAGDADPVQRLLVLDSLVHQLVRLATRGAARRGGRNSAIALTGRGRGRWVQHPS